MFMIAGGESPLTDIFTGNIQDANDDFHYSAKGQRLWGESLAKSILSILK